MMLTPSPKTNDSKLKQPARDRGWFASLALAISIGLVLLQLNKHVDLCEAVEAAVMRFGHRTCVTSAIHHFNESSANFQEDTLQSYQCQPLTSSTVILSTDPLIMHIHNFVTPFEAQHLIRLAEERFVPSIVGAGDNGKLVKEARQSMSALLPDVVGKSSNTIDPVISCVLQKAAAFQGNIPLNHTEPLQVLKYTAGGFYRAHVDPFLDAQDGGARGTSFFVMLKSQGLLGTGLGGTSFVEQRRRPGHEPGLCEVVECGNDEKEGLTWKPIEGSAVFWKNLHEDGSVHMGTLHRGVELPESEHAVKIAMNIWTWTGPYGY